MPSDFSQNDIDSAVGWVTGAQTRSAKNSVVQNLDTDPDQAAHALQMEKLTGVPATTMMGDYDGFNQGFKAKSASEIIGNNPALQSYINDHPLAAAVSNDDWANIDETHDAIRRIGVAGPSTIMQGGRVAGSLLSQFAGAFKDAFDAPGLSEEFEKTRNAIPSMPGLGAALILPELFSHEANAALAGASAVVGGIARQMGMNEADANRLVRDAFILPQVAIPELAKGGVLPPELQRGVVEDAQKAIIEAHVKDFQDTAAKYLQAGEPIPFGVHPIIDKLYEAQAKLDAESVNEALKIAVKSATRERAPEMFAEALRKETKSDIYVSADAVRRLYGEAGPAPEDGVLGWVPDIVQQLSAAEATGGDVKIPLANWLAKVDPKVAKELHDDLKVRAEGLTLNEAKEVVSTKAQELPGVSFGKTEVEELESIRQGAANDQVKKLSPGQLPPPKDLIERIWDNYAKNMTPEEFLESEALWSGAKDLQEDWGTSEHEAFSFIANRIFERMNIPRRMNPQQARRYIAEARGIRPVDISGPLVRNERRAAGLTSRLGEAGDWESIGAGAEALPIKSELLSAQENQIVGAINEEIKKLVPRLVDVHGVEGIKLDERHVQGIYHQYTRSLPLLLWSIESEDPLGTGRHEAIHHLRQYGFFHQAEWDTLQRAAIQEDWMKKYNIHRRYSGQSLTTKLEEAIADRFANWRRGEDIPDGRIHQVFEKIKALLENIKGRVREILGKDPTWQDLFRKVEKGEIGARRGVEPQEEGAFRPPQAQEMPEGAAKLQPKDRLRKYFKLIERQNDEDIARQIKEVEKDIRQRQTKEWREAEGATRKEVKTELASRPDLLADSFLREGKFHGVAIEGSGVLDGSKLTEEQKAALPKDYYAKTGLDPDDVAGLFGYSSGEAMVNRLGMLDAARKALRLDPEAYEKKLTDDEVERRMQKSHGDLAENILAEAREHVVNNTELDIRYEIVKAMAEDAGQRVQSKAELKAQVKESFGQLPHGPKMDVKYLQEAGKAGRAMEKAFLEGDYAEAFRQSLRQLTAVMYAAEGAKFDKELKKFEALTKKLSKREITGDQSYAPYMHDLLLRIGKPIERSVQDLQQEMGKQSLTDFLLSKATTLNRFIQVPEEFLDPSYRKDVANMSVDEVREVHNALKMMDKNAREEKRADLAGQKFDLDQVMMQMWDQAATHKERVYTQKPTGAFRELMNVALYRSLTLESMFDRLDRDDPFGVFTQAIIRHFVEGGNYADVLARKYARQIRALSKYDTNLKRKVENPILRSPHTGELLPMDIATVRSILQHTGNKSNWEKFTKGWKVDPDLAWRWLNSVTTKQDWDWAQAQGRIFEAAYKEARTMYASLYGVGPEALEMLPVQSAHGTYDGWYHPIRYSKTFEGKSKELMGGEADTGENKYRRAMTAAGYKFKRTNYFAPIELSLNQTPVALNEMIRDIALRPAIVNGSKYFYNDKFREMIKRFYNEQAANDLVPYLHAIAGTASVDVARVASWERVLEQSRQNIIAGFVGMNPGTVLKHGPTAAINSMTEVGPARFAKAMKSLFATNEKTGESNWRFAMDTSEELQRRMRNYAETLGGASDIVLGKPTLRQTLQELGSKPVAWSDLMSAVPTWLAGYEKAIGEGMTHGDAVFVADRGVRRAHGSTAITNRPGHILHGGAAGRWLGSLYGFFSHMLQGQYRMMWEVNETLGLVKQGEYADAAKNLPKLTAMFMSYVIAPALIEEMVTPYTNKEKESWAHWSARVLATGVSSSWLVARDIVHGIAQGHDPSVGLFSEVGKTLYQAIRDVQGAKFDKAHLGKTLQHTVAAFGLATGYSNVQEGRWLKALHDYFVGVQRPRGAGDVERMFRHGDVTKSSPLEDATFGRRR